MSSTINKVEIEGYVGSKPEYRITKYNEEIAKFVVGTEDLLFSDLKKQWHTVVVADYAALKIVKREIDKGTRVHIVGTLYTYKEEKQYISRHISEIVVTPTGSIKIIHTEINPPVTIYYD